MICVGGVEDGGRAQVRPRAPGTAAHDAGTEGYSSILTYPSLFQGFVVAIRHQVIEQPPDAVWAVLEDPELYADWVVGTSASWPLDTRWPQVDAALAYRVDLGPWTLEGRTVVRRVEPPRWLELEVDSGRLGTARIAIEVRPWGGQALVLVDEHPLRGPGGVLHAAPLDLLIQLRHRSMLPRLARTVERVAAAAPGSTSRATAGGRATSGRA